MTKVSVIIPAFNAERFIRTAIESACGQTEADLEIIVVDDCSRDRTAEVIQEIGRTDPRVRLMRNRVNGGPGQARNVAIAEAVGDWIALLDADDWYDRRRLEVLTRLGQERDAEIVTDNQFFVESEHSRPWRTLTPDRPGVTRELPIDEFLRNDMPGQHATFGLMKPLIRRSFLVEHGIEYDTDVAYGGEDFFLIMECYAKSPRFIYHATPLYYYRTRPDSLSATFSVGDYENFAAANARLLALFSDESQTTARTLMEKRFQALGRYIRYREIVESLKGGDWGSALGKACRDLRIVPFLLVGLTKVMFARARKQLVRLTG